MEAEDRLPVRATVHLQGLAAGERAWIDPADPYMAELLAAQLLVADDSPRMSPMSEFEDADAAPDPGHVDDVGG